MTAFRSDQQKSPAGDKPDGARDDARSIAGVQP